MNKDIMAQMSTEELNEYGAMLGLVMKSAKTKQDKLDYIERKRAKIAEIKVLGLDLEVPVKRMRDKRVSDLVNKKEASDDELVEALKLILGNEQFEQVISAVTDEDGTIDVVALALCFSRIITSKELKNF